MNVEPGEAKVESASAADSRRIGMLTDLDSVTIAAGQMIERRAGAADSGRAVDRFENIHESFERPGR